MCVLLQDIQMIGCFLEKSFFFLVVFLSTNVFLFKGGSD